MRLKCKLLDVYLPRRRARRLCALFFWCLLGGLVGFSSGSSGAASKIIWTKTGHGTYLCLILIHTKFEKKS